jgi:hypothetical protein
MSDEKSIVGSVTIARREPNGVIVIEIREVGNRIPIAEAELSPHWLGMALTGRSEVPAYVTRRKE